eukprot:5254718-Amphidinium_carterae.1
MLSGSDISPGPCLQKQMTQGRQSGSSQEAPFVRNITLCLAIREKHPPAVEKPQLTRDREKHNLQPGADMLRRRSFLC